MSYEQDLILNTADEVGYLVGRAVQNVLLGQMAKDLGQTSAVKHYKRMAQTDKQMAQEYWAKIKDGARQFHPDPEKFLSELSFQIACHTQSNVNSRVAK